MTTSVRDAYDGPFDPDLHLGDFSRQTLADLGREYLLMGHLAGTCASPLVMQGFGPEASTEISIEQWMGASPIYSKRMQRALGFEGDTVETVFKNLQIEVGAPAQFMDFQFRLDRPDYGEFWLPHCGALMDVEPHGEQAVRLMCHDIEDPTFDATAAAVNRMMKMRPIHRPPRVPEGRYPHCHWKVYIDDLGEPAQDHPSLSGNREARIATIGLDIPEEGREPGGWADYAGPLDPGFQLEDLCHRALVVVNQEVAAQCHILTRSYLRALVNRFGEQAAIDIAPRHWIGIAALAAERLPSVLGIEGDGIDAIAKVFQFHPHLWPRTYIDLRVELTSENSALLAIGDCPALQEGDALSWFASLDEKPHPAFDAIASVVNPRARCHPASSPGAALAWEVVIDPTAEPRPEPPEFALAKANRGASFQMMRRRPLRK
jgi:hypothetical protein